MKSLISIIIPVYNVETYLVECIESVLKQTYQNIEILLIDDGSPDNSGKICDEYAKKDSRVRVIHKENGGVSSARNVGLEQAKGEYLTFVDSDDFVDECYVEKMYDNLQENNSDLVFCSYSNYIDGKSEKSKEKLPENLKVDIQNENFIDFICRFFIYKDYVFGSVWRILYTKKFINSLNFNLSVKIGEDSLFLLNAILQTQKISFIKAPLYFYRQNKNSVMHNYKKNYLKSQLSLYFELKKLFGLFKDKKSKNVFQTHSVFLCYYTLTNEIKFKPENWKENIQQVRDSELYLYFKLKNGLKVYGLKQKIKFFIVWFLVKTRLI